MVTSQRGPIPRYYWRWCAVTALLALAASLVIVGGVAHETSYVSRRNATSRSYKHLSSPSLSTIPHLANAATSLDHHDPKSFVSRILIPRVPGTSNHRKVQQIIKEVFTSEPLSADHGKGRSGWHMEEDTFENRTPMGKKPFTNLIFTKNPHASRKLVISAHYDSKYFDRGDFVAATDSAAPCAMMVDLAIALDKALEVKMGQHKNDEDVTLQLIFFDGEEAFKVWTHTDSTYGSRNLAANWSHSFFQPRRLTTHTPMRKIDSIEHLVLLDLLGSKDPSIPSYFFSTDWLFRELISAEERLRDANVLYPSSSVSSSSSRPRSFFRNGPVTMGGIEDDHLPFLAHGVPILHVIPTPFPSVWHTLKDDASALDWPTDYAWAMILRLWTAEYLGLDVGMQGKRDQEADDGWGDDSWVRSTRDELASIIDGDDRRRAVNASGLV